MYIGIDLGGTNIAGGLVNDEGVIVMKKSVPTLTERGSEAVIEDIAHVIQMLIDANTSNQKPIAVGIGIPGVSDPITGDVPVCINLNWYNVPLRRRLQEQIDLPIFIDNDATVAGVAEFEIAQEGRYKNAVLLTLGTGIGSGIMIDGKMVSGHHGIGSEFGHTIVGENFYTCNCGHNGCLETFSSSTAIIKYMRHRINDEGAQSDVVAMADGNTANINGEMIFKAAMNGDLLAVETIDRLVKYLAIGMINLVATLDPEIILLGGGLSMAGDFLLNKVVAALHELKYYKALPIAKVAIAKLRNDAGIAGAAMYAKLHMA
ncbi:ROK family protein [Fusibacter paucivorans]|uniref:ROK family protein n=1 Tax=Fusibacter paucivorans TaxID=76009 RepID=A0ABS5PVY3_9FIRM|nr:ROK family protein [Fusibacter paucivorans]MBS7528377.1 ROK family protein [Fusibacter paucivorans]